MGSDAVGKIMIIDDEDVVRELIKDMVESLGYQVVDFSDPKKAIDYYKENYESITVVFLDMIMPGLNGRETFFLLKEINRDIKSIVLSGFSLNEDIEKILKEGCCAYLKKPVRINEFERTLDMVLNPDVKNDMKFGIDESTDVPEIISFGEYNMDEEFNNMGLNEEIFTKMLKRFIENYSDAAVKMVELAKKKKYDELFIFSHSIKSIAAGIGLLRLKAFSELIESSCLEKSFSEIESEVEYFKTEFDCVLDKIAEYLFKVKEKDGADKIEEKEENVESIVVYIDELIKYAGKGRPRQIREIFEKKFIPAIAPFLDVSFKNDVAKMIRNYNYNELIIYLKKIKNSINKV